MTTVRQIASELGLSPATVSRSLNGSHLVRDDVRARVVLEAKRVGYRPRRSVSTRPGQTVRNQVLGLAFLNGTSGAPFGGYDATLWTGVAQGARSQGCDVCLVDLRDRQVGESYAKFLLRKRLAGLIIRVDSDSHETAIEIARSGVEVVVMADCFEEEEVNYVYCDSRRASEEAVRHLIEMGHERIGLCHNRVMDRDHRDRINGYKAALQSAGLPVTNDLLIDCPADLESGSAALTRFLSMTAPPSAIFFTDPQTTVGGLKRALEIGVRVPEELSVIGVDDDAIRRMTFPTFTAVCQDAIVLGRHAARWFSRSDSERPAEEGHQPIQLTLHAFLEINHSTAPPSRKPIRFTPNGQRLEVL